MKEQRTQLRNCRLGYQCEKRWEDLDATNLTTIRHCSQCEQEVHLCDNDSQLMTAMKHNWCVAINRNHDNMNDAPSYNVGKIEAVYQVSELPCCE